MLMFHHWPLSFWWDLLPGRKEPQNEDPNAMNLFVRLKEKNGAKLPEDRLAIVFMPLQGNNFFSWRISGWNKTPGSKGKSYSERLKTDQKLSEGEHCSKLKEQINCNACVFIIQFCETSSYQALWTWLLFMPPCNKYTQPELHLT